VRLERWASEMPPSHNQKRPLKKFHCLYDTSVCLLEGPGGLFFPSSSHIRDDNKTDGCSAAAALLCCRRRPAATAAAGAAAAAYYGTMACCCCCCCLLLLLSYLYHSLVLLLLRSELLSLSLLGSIFRSLAALSFFPSLAVSLPLSLSQ
jgi:hypothetical protein